MSSSSDPALASAEVDVEVRVSEATTVEDKTWEREEIDGTASGNVLGGGLEEVKGESLGPYIPPLH